MMPKVVYAFNSNKTVISEFAFLLGSCKSLFFSFTYNSHLEFTKRNTNKVVHSLPGVTLLSVSPHDYFEIPICN